MENWKMLLLMLLMFALAACSSQEEETVVSTQEEEETGVIMAMSSSEHLAYQRIHIADYEQTLKVLLEHVDIEQVCSTYRGFADSKSEQGLPVRLQMPMRLARECFPESVLFLITGKEGKIDWVEIQ